MFGAYGFFMPGAGARAAPFPSVKDRGQDVSTTGMPLIFMHLHCNVLYGVKSRYFSEFGRPLCEADDSHRQIEAAYRRIRLYRKNRFDVQRGFGHYAGMRYDIHVHSALSPCGQMEAGDILTHAARCGLDGICITDHDSMLIRHHLREGLQDNGLWVIFGMEYTTTAGDFLLFGPFEELPLGLPAGELLNLVAAYGGAAVAAHPFRSDRPVKEEIVRAGLCRIVESINGRNTRAENQKIAGWRKKFSLVECGGSDAHTRDEMGSVATRFHIPVRSRKELIRALQLGLCCPEPCLDNSVSVACPSEAS